MNLMRPSKPKKTSAIIHNDEPTSQDRLNREQYAQAFATLAETCSTPMVIGIYGTWGVGKTSLMKLIEENLDPDKTRTVWFDAWEHQFDENPVVSLTHTLVAGLGPDWMKEGKKLLKNIGTAFASSVLHKATGFNVRDIDRVNRIFEDDRFEARDIRVKLRAHFQTLIERSRKMDGPEKRLVFFIDDLDRCMPDEAMKLIESLKLYLNIEGCIYFLGVDRDALEHGINQRYEGMDMEEAEYLDKIVQLPFTVPPIEPQCMHSFIEPLLSDELINCTDMLVKNLGNNPRQVKRFVNTLSFNHQLANGVDIPGYDPRVLVLLLLIQLKQPKLYKKIAIKPDLIENLRKKTKDSKEIFEAHLAGNPRLQYALNNTKIPRVAHLKTYIYLTNAVSVMRDMGTEIPYSAADLLECADNIVGKLMQRMIRKNGITVAEAVSKFGLETEEAQKHLDDLVENGSARKAKTKKGTVYKAVLARKVFKKSSSSFLDKI